MGGTPRAEIFVVLADIGFTRWQGIRHEVIEADHPPERVKLVVIFCATKEMPAAPAPDHVVTSVCGDLQDSMKAESSPPLLCQRIFH